MTKLKDGLEYELDASLMQPEGGVLKVDRYVTSRARLISQLEVGQTYTETVMAPDGLTSAQLREWMTGDLLNQRRVIQGCASRVTKGSPTMKFTVETGSFISSQYRSMVAIVVIRTE